MSEDLPKGKAGNNAVARRRRVLVIQAIAILLLLCAGIGVVLLESTSSDPTQKQVRALVAELERAESNDWLSRLLREFFPEYGKSRAQYEVVDELTALGVEAVPEIIKAAGHRLPSVRYAAVVALHKIGDRRAVAPLADLLARDSDTDVREAAASALGRLNSPEATDRLIDAMADPEPSVREMVAWALGDVGSSKATDRLIDAMADPEPAVREAVASALGNIGGPKAAARLIEAMKDVEPSVREAAAGWLGRISDSAMVLNYGNQEDPVRVAARAIGQQCLPQLIELLKGQEEYLRIASAQALGEFGDPAAVEPLLETITDAEDRVRKAAAQALGEIGDARATPALLAALSDENVEVRAAAAHSLGFPRDPRAVDALISALNDKDDTVRAASAFALALQKRPEAVPVLEAAFTGEDDWSAFAAVVGLALIDTPGARQALAAGARKAVYPAVRRLAARAQAMPLVAALAEELRGKDHTLQLYILDAFAYLRDPASLPALEEALKSPNPNIRHEVGRAIRHIRRANQPQAAGTPAQE